MRGGGNEVTEPVYQEQCDITTHIHLVNQDKWLYKCIK